MSGGADAATAGATATRRPVDAVALQRAARRLAGAAEPPWLHAEVARRMAERLPVVKQTPATVVDWGAHSGASGALLRTAYRRARILRIDDAAPPTGRPAGGWWARWRRDATVGAEAVAPAAAQLVWANMMLHLAPDPAAVMARWRDALTIDGFLMMSTLGPDTLRTLREIYRSAGWGEPHAPFVDMHDLGDMLVHAGFADPVMDQELLRLTWATPAALLAELRGLGANAAPRRHAGLRTPRWRARLEAALAERAGADGRIALEFEIVYGHAFKPTPRVRVAGETRLSAADLQRMARTGRKGEPLR